MQLGQLSRSEDDFGDVKANRNPWIAKLSQPIQRTPLDELLLVLIHRVSWTTKGSAGSRFDLHKTQGLSMPCDDIHFTSVQAAVVSKKYAAPMALEMLGGEEFPQKADL
jgi:hypothetical protein